MHIQWFMYVLTLWQDRGESGKGWNVELAQAKEITGPQSLIETA